MSENERRDEPGKAEDQADAAAEAAAKSTTDADPHGEVNVKPQPEAEAVPVPTRDKPAGDYPSGVEEAAEALAEGVDLPERPESGPTKTRQPQEIESGPGDPSGPRPRPQEEDEGDLI